MNRSSMVQRRGTAISAVRLILILATISVSIACGGDKDGTTSYPKRNHDGLVEATRADSAAAASSIAKSLGLTPPLRLHDVGGYWDGGTNYGTFVDAVDETLHFCLAGKWEVPSFGYLYTGSVYFERPGAVRVDPESAVEVAIIQALILYPSDEKQFEHVAGGMLSILVRQN